jgi:hypothetical protein
MKQARTRAVQFLDDGETTPRTLEVSESLAAAVERAAQVSKGKDPFLVSFTSLFIGLLTAPDAVGEWLTAQFNRSGAHLDELLRRRAVDRRELKQLAKTGALKFSERPLSLSKSARSALDEAQRLARDRGVLLDTRHVLAAYIALPKYHEDDFRGMGIDRVAWAAAFSQAMAESYPDEEKSWLGFADSVFPGTTAASPSDAMAVDLGEPGVEVQVVKALREALVLAGSGQVLPSHVLAAVVNLSKQALSPAFEHFAKMVPLLQPHPSKSARSEVPLDAGRLDEALRRQLAWAQRPGSGKTRPHGVWGRDLVTAALLCSDESAKMLENAGRSIEVVRATWHAFVTKDTEHRSSEEWDAWWRAAGMSRPESLRAGYATETDEGDDKLGVVSEARAFARLILDRKVEAPLSIGLLGDWGSGKSFFIEQIKKQIAELKKENRPELYGNPVEIEFNAWHASDANLWASLVTYIFDEIWERVSLDDEKKSPEEARRLLLKEIEKARGAVHETETQVDLGRVALEKAEHDLEARRSELAWVACVTSITREELTKLAKDAGWHEPLETINAVDAAARSLGASGARLRLVVAALVQKPLRYIALPMAVMAALVAGVWTLFEVWSPDAMWVATLSKWMAALIGAVGALVGPLKAASGKVSGFADKLDTIHNEYDRELEKEKTENPEKFAQLTKARREFESAEASVIAARTRLGELLNQQAALDPRRRLGAFLQERVQSTQYRSQQGIISLVHKDFRQLSSYMKDLRTSLSQPNDGEQKEAGIKPFDRIVLYVDDLDRCRPDQVVNMLEAVHLLLALDLFVVVVAVDSRWLTRALETHYGDLLVATDGPLRASTPQSYLEKIFQITYALGPMDPLHFANYVAFLAGAEVEAGTDEKAAPRSEEISPRPTNRSTSDASDRDETSRTKAKPSEVKRVEKPVAPAPKALPPAHAVRIDKGEQALICRLVPLLPTPRIAKRLVNVYRVIKAGKSVAALEAFENERRADSCLLMLAILFGRPAVASELFRALHEKKAPFEDREQLFLKAVGQRKAVEGEPAYVREEWKQLHATLEGLSVTATVGECAREPIEVARYSLVSGHDWHTWARSSPPSASSVEEC